MLSELLSEFELAIFGMILGMIGGVANLLQKPPLDKWCWIRDPLYSACMGLMVWYGATGLGLSSGVVAALCGTTGHFGARLCKTLEYELTDFIHRWFDHYKPQCRICGRRGCDDKHEH